MLKRLLSLALIAAALTVLCVPAALANETWYVYTENGKSLNVRRLPNGEVIGGLAFGSPVNVIEYSASGWSLIWFAGKTGSTPAYVQSRYLVRTQPVPGGGGQPESADWAAVNREFRSARLVQYPYTVVARPARASGWVNLRWAPCTKAEVITTCSNGKPLLVLAELTNWYQVQDPATSMIGFISKEYVAVAR